jgi:NAD(P)-dependent dehydrogenase (short-subunit alcohol dehydrogenase family)
MAEHTVASEILRAFWERPRRAGERPKVPDDITREADVRDAAALRAAVASGVARLGAVDIVVANAGIGMMSEDASEEQAFRDQVEVNLFGVWNTVQAAAPVMIEQGRGGAIVLTGSTLGLVGRGGNGRGRSDGYCASKHAIVGLGRTWAHWLAPHNIRVNSVHPAGVNTPMMINEAVAKLFASTPRPAAPTWATSWTSSSSKPWTSATRSPGWSPTRPATSPPWRSRSTPGSPPSSPGLPDAHQRAPSPAQLLEAA